MPNIGFVQFENKSIGPVRLFRSSDEILSLSRFFFGLGFPKIHKHIFGFLLLLEMSFNQNEHKVNHNFFGQKNYCENNSERNDFFKTIRLIQ